MLTTLTCSGLQPTEEAVAVRSHAEEPQPVHKAMSKKSVSLRIGYLLTAGLLAELDGFGDMCRGNVGCIGQIGDGAGNAQQPVISTGG